VDVARAASAHVRSIQVRRLGRVDYGEAHAKEAGHQRYGKTYASDAALHPGWSEASPVHLLGHSMGAGVALAYALRYQDELRGLVLSGPAVLFEGVSPLQARAVRILSALAPGLPVFAIDGTAVSRDPEVVRAYDRDPLNYRGKIPVRTAAEMARSAEQLPDRLGSLRLPLLLLHGTEDRLVPANASRLVHDRASSLDKTLRLYDGLYHEVFNEPERDQVLADLTHWLDWHA